MDAMVQMPDKFIQLSCVDPPYGIGYDTQAMSGANTQYGVALGKKKDYGKSNWDEVIPDKLYFSELFRVSKHQIIWGGNYFIDHLISTKSWCFWYKRTNGQFSDGELAWTSFDIPLRVFDFLWNGMMQGDMKNKEDRIHPTQKPVALYKWLLKNYAKPGDKIFDSHMGSQSSRIAAYQMGFDYFGTELDADYFRDGCKRFDAVIHKKDTQEYEAKPEGSGTLF
jgi:site-specific DNA-methyltransferase (adenine-specific)